MTTAYTQGHAAGFREACERAHLSDATSGDDAATWFTAPVGQSNVDDHKRGFVAGFAEYFTARD